METLFVALPLGVKNPPSSLFPMVLFFLLSPLSNGLLSLLGVKITSGLERTLRRLDASNRLIPFSRRRLLLPLMLLDVGGVGGAGVGVGVGVVLLRSFDDGNDGMIAFLLPG